ncbi:MAG TPA: phosphate acyltransferase PlsX [Vicinamibacterales bacterium]|nr:phosphate acyltransferase PlsX [Vicinamibacterales bacterium]
MSNVVVAVDALGGDHAPGAPVLGALHAARRGIAVTLVGPTSDLQAELHRHGDWESLPLKIEEAPDSVQMTEAPLSALRRKPRASVRVAANLVASGHASAMFSAGHTGATLLAAHAAFGVLDGVERPALAVTVPTRTGAALLLDAGANVDCRPEHLVQFAIMGAAYARVALQIERPKVGLLSIGEEASKGNDLIREAHQRLQSAPIDFIGNLEAREFFTGRADVIVCDGFTGNIALKVGESLVEAVDHMLREELGAELLTQLGALLTRRAFSRFKQRVDYAEYGGAPLLGVGGVALVGHGRSSAQAIENGIALAARLAETGIVERLADALKPTATR